MFRSIWVYMLSFRDDDGTDNKRTSDQHWQPSYIWPIRTGTIQNMQTKSILRRLSPEGIRKCSFTEMVIHYGYSASHIKYTSSLFLNVYFAMFLFLVIPSYTQGELYGAVLRADNRSYFVAHDPRNPSLNWPMTHRPWLCLVCLIAYNILCLINRRTHANLKWIISTLLSELISNEIKQNLLQVIKFITGYCFIQKSNTVEQVN